MQLLKACPTMQEHESGTLTRFVCFTDHAEVALTVQTETRRVMLDIY